jgi:hypothetical protein
MPKFPLVLLMCLAACGGNLPGPSVPTQSGKNLDMANAAVASCAQFAPRGGKNAVVGNYVGGVLLLGIIIGPIIVASNEDDIRANGEADAVDKCLAKQGYMRRDLTPAEVSTLNASSPSERRRILDHLVGGGSLETLS